MLQSVILVGVFLEVKKAFQNLGHKGILCEEPSRLNKLFVKEQSRHRAMRIRKEINTNIIISIVTQACIIIFKPKRHRAYLRVLNRNLGATEIKTTDQERARESL